MGVFRRTAVVVMVVLLVVSVAPVARSAPMWTDLATIRASASLIAIGVVHVAAGPNNTPSITLDVEKVVRGTAAPGPLAVKESPDGHVFVDSARVLAFVDQNGALRWIGKLVAGPSLETGVIQLQGFFDFNAHVVNPGLMTLAELKTYLATGQLDQTFDATLAFRDGRGGLARSSRTLTVQYSPATRALHVSGTTPACLTANALFGLEWGNFELRFTDNCPSQAPNAPYRSLDLDGKFTGVDATSGHIQVEIAPTRPFLTESEYATFAADGAIAEMISVVGVALSDGTSWTWRLEKDLVDPSGKAHSAGGVSMSSQTSNGKTVERDTYEFDGGVKIVLSPSASVGSPGGNARGIVSLVDSKTLGACTFVQSGHPDRACSLTTRAPVIVRR